jgi:hypothetical protein
MVRLLAVPEGSLAVRIVVPSNGGGGADGAGVGEPPSPNGVRPGPTREIGRLSAKLRQGAPAMLSIADQFEGLAKTTTQQRRQGL